MWLSLSKKKAHKNVFKDPLFSVGKESACNAGDPALIAGLGRCAGEGIGYPLQYSWVSFGAQLVKNPPAMQETWVWSLGWEDPLEKGKATHSSLWPGEFHGLYSLLLLLLSRFSRVWLCVTPETAAHPSLWFPRQEHWSGLPFPSPMHESEKWKWSHSVVSDS